MQPPRSGCSPRALLLVLPTVLACGASLLQSQNRESALLVEIETELHRSAQYGMYDWVRFSLDRQTVTLSGWVHRPSVKEAIGRLIANLPGVASVDNAIEILSQSDADRGIRAAAYEKIFAGLELRKYDPAYGYRGTTGRRKPTAHASHQVVKYPIHLIVHDRSVRIEGNVETVNDRILAGKRAATVVGLESIENNLLVLNLEEPARTLSHAGSGPTVRIVNRFGGVTADVERVGSVAVVVKDARGHTIEGGYELNRRGKSVSVFGRDSSSGVNLHVRVPYGLAIEVGTTNGAIEVRGLAPRVQIDTESGAVTLSCPWQAMSLDLASEEKPARLAVPKHLGISSRHGKAPGSPWLLRTNKGRRAPPYGEVTVRAERPQSLDISDFVIPADAPVKMHWQAPDLLKEAFRGGAGPALSARPQESVPRQGGPGSDAMFTSDVRLVNLSVAVRDASGRSVTGLVAEDFEIREGGQLQEVRFFRAEEMPFNLVLLLDCSQSTDRDRTTLRAAAEGFLSVARPQDRVALSVLANSHFHSLVDLTDPRAAIRGALDPVYRLSGHTPLYDVVALAYVHELSRLRNQRNALIVVTDGMDNRLMDRIGTPSKLSIGELRKAALEMNVLIYPVSVDPLPSLTRVIDSQVVASEWKRLAGTGLAQLAEASGGRLFHAGSLDDLEMVYGQVGEELRSVYTLGYYPGDQEFDGEWRSVRVKVKRPNARVHARPGYRAW